MGTYRIEIEATGGHGCDRRAKEGEAIQVGDDCGCPDCTAARFVASLARNGSSVASATLTHWPGQPGEVVDDLAARRRKRGSFGG